MERKSSLLTGALLLLCFLIPSFVENAGAEFKFVIVPIRQVVVSESNPAHLVQREIDQAREIFKKLLDVSFIKEKDDVALEFLSEWMLRGGFAGGGCYEEAVVYGQKYLSLQTPFVMITYGKLWLDRGKDVPVATLRSLAHELGHLERVMTSRGSPMICKEFYGDEGLYKKNSKQEELDADQRGALMLNRAGYDGVAIMIEGTKIMCEQIYGCSSSSPTHPSAEERIRALEQLREK